MTRTHIVVAVVLCIPFWAVLGQESREVRGRFDPIPLTLNAAVSLLTNPASAIFTDSASTIRIGPSAQTSTGSYRRLFDADAAQSYSVGGAVVNVLGNKGTFRGAASYVYEDWQQVFAALRMNPYGGDGFTATDTSRGDVRYMGPRVHVEYAYELIGNCAIGFLTSYEVLDGLKGAYSYAHTTFRDITYGVGVQYQFDHASRAGFVVRGLDQQEAIESKSSDDLMDVEIFSFRGERYATKRRGSTVEETYRVRGWELQGEGKIEAFPDVTVSASGTFREVGLRSLFPSGLTKEFEDGYAHQQRIAANTSIAYLLLPGVVVHAGLDGVLLESWSKVSSRSLLMWAWDYYHTDVSLGIDAIVSDGLLVRAEGWVRNGEADSSKYIDATRSTSPQSGVGGIAGLAYRWSEQGNVSINGWMNTADLDVQTGGTDARETGLQATIGWKITPRIEIEFTYGWFNRSGTMADRELSRNGHVYSLVIQLPQD